MHPAAEHQLMWNFGAALLYKVKIAVTKPLEIVTSSSEDLPAIGHPVKWTAHTPYAVTREQACRPMRT